MREREEYEFWIDAYSPETISMKRLGEYMTRLGRLLGQEERVHFLEVRGGSTALAMNIEREAVPKISQRIESIKNASASNDAMFIQNELNEMLRSDNAIGELRRLVGGDTPPTPMLRFAGREIPKPQKIGPFSESATFKGQLIRLEGRDATKHAGIMDVEGRVWKGVMPIELAVQMRELLFEWVIVEGTAKWVRNESENWEVTDFHILNCEPLSKTSLVEDVNRLRGVADNQWKDMPDPISIIRELRSDDDEVH